MNTSPYPKRGVQLLQLLVNVWLLAAAIDVAAQDKRPELKLSTAQSAAFPLGLAGERWKDLINARVGIAFEVKQYAGAVLAQRDAARELMALKDGAADLAVGSALTWSTQAPVLTIYALPWLAWGDQLNALVADRAVQRAVVEGLGATGVVVLAIAPLGERVLSTVKGPVGAPADLSGLRVRAAPAPIVADTLAALGARPTAMGYTQAQDAFIAGALDAQESTATALAASRIAATGQKFVTRWGAFSDAMLFVVRQPVWERWNDAQREMVRAAASEAAQETNAIAREDAAFGELSKQGVTLVRLAPAQRGAFRRAVGPVWAKWTGVLGPDLVRAAEAAVAGAAR